MQFLFSNYALDVGRRELKRGSELISMGPQVFDLLVYLVQNRDHVVSKDDLLQAVWGGRIVSESTLTSHINAVRKAIGDTGEEQSLIRTISRKGFRFVGEVGKEPAPPIDAADQAAAGTTPSAAALSLPDKPSIAVLPFQNFGDDPVQDYFADGVVEDIISALSRMRWLFVIARNSSFTYKGRAADVKLVGRELGVRYVLEGSVRKAGSRVRITGQLIDASNGASLWTDRFEGTLDDIFDLQDQVTANVVGAIAPSLERAEIARVKSKPTESLDAYDYFLQGLACFYKRTLEDNSQALRLFLRATELDPDYASAYGMAAWCHVWRKLNGWMTDLARDTAEAGRLARLAVALGQDDAVALASGGHSLSYLLGEHDDGAAFLDRALTLNPNLAIAWMYSGWVRNYCGEPDAAIERLARAMRLSPLDPYQYNMQTGTAFAHMLAGRYEEAASWAAKAYRHEPRYLPAAGVMAASQAHAGRLDQARQAVGRLREIDPAFRISNLKAWYPLRRPEDLANYSEGLRKAGLPE